MSIFNSLGSNYTFGMAARAILKQGSSDETSKLIQLLEKRYDGKAILTYKGREALYLGLRSLQLPKGSAIAITGFTCYAVYKAVIDAGLNVIFLDIDDSLNFTPETLEKAIQKHSTIRGVIVQNTLGIPCDITGINAICKENNLFLIEDLAHCVGGKYASGLEMGTVGDVTVLSFSQDKVIDAVSGGALVVRNKRIKIPNNLVFEEPSSQWRDRMYPLLTYLIRLTYGIQLGKYIHYFAKRSNLLPQPMSGIQTSNTHSLPDWYCNLVNDQFAGLGTQLDHRRKIAKRYAEKLPKDMLFIGTANVLDTSTNLRFPIRTQKRAELIQFLKVGGIHISDIWYDAPIAPKKYLSKTTYSQDCPLAERISEEIVNLPTHRDISLETADYIISKITEWHKSQ